MAKKTFKLRSAPISKADRLKKEQAQKKHDRRTNILLAIGGAAVLLAVAAVIFINARSSGATIINRAQAQTISEGSALVIPTADIDRTVSFYPVTVNGTNMEVLTVKATDGTVRTAFNTCQQCYTSGRGYYKQVGSRLICQNCGNSFDLDHVETEYGGCNPWPITTADKTVTDSDITISYDFFNKTKQVFASWN